MGIYPINDCRLVYAVTTTAIPTPTPTATATPTPMPTPIPILTGTLNGEVVFEGNLGSSWERSLPHERFVAIADVSWMDLQSVSSLEVEPRIVATGTIPDDITRESPVPFTVNYNPEDIDPSSVYAVIVKYFIGGGRGGTSGGVVFTNYYGIRSGSTPLLVLTGGAPRQNVKVHISLIRWRS